MSPIGSTQGAQSLLSINDLGELNRRRHCRSADAIAMAALGVAVLIFAAFFYDSLLNQSAARLLGLVALFIGFVALSFICAHAWALVLIDLLYQKVFFDRDRLEALETRISQAEAVERDTLADEKRQVMQQLGNRRCGYCGESLAPILCRGCGSIQWSDLRRGNPVGEIGVYCLTSKRKHTVRWNWAWAVFICHHRFKLVAAVSSILFLGILPFAFQLSYERAVRRASEHAAEVQQARTIMTRLNSFRAALHEWNDVCLDSHRTDDLCSALSLQVKKDYLEVSWHAAPVLEFLQRQCNMQPIPAFKKNLNASQPRTPLAALASGRTDVVSCARRLLECGESEKVELHKLACAVAGVGDPVGFLDERYRDTLNAYREYNRSRMDVTYEPSNEGQELSKKVSRQAALLYLGGRQVGCLIFSLAYGDREGVLARSEETPWLQVFSTCAPSLYDLGSELERYSKREPPREFDCRERDSEGVRNDWVWSSLQETASGADEKVACSDQINRAADPKTSEGIKERCEEAKGRLNSCL